MTHQITVVGLGVGELEQLPFGIYKLLKETTLPRLFADSGSSCRFRTDGRGNGIYIV